MVCSKMPEPIFADPMKPADGGVKLRTAADRRLTPGLCTPKFEGKVTLASGVIGYAFP
jgi:hypothetical protein